eukprot:TRINITY_DN7401_c0_g1_i11.p1 TRINITY_DN7401_c0_g1~~TRINITY_DN7401_c0_g1_i11.p1  ORF type:complete len:165 (-),score=38.06 TRINITY_DN7401_c0_g1_i11:156-650(-)
MIRRPPRSTLSSSSAASDVYKRQTKNDSVRYIGIGGSCVLLLIAAGFLFSAKCVTLTLQPQENSFEVRTWSIVSNTTATESLHGLQHVETRRGGKSGIGHSGMWGIHAVFEGGEDKQMIISSDRDKAKKWAGVIAQWAGVRVGARIEADGIGVDAVDVEEQCVL